MLLSDAIHDASQNKCVTRGVTPDNSPPSHSFCSLRELGPNDLIIRDSKTGYRCQKCTQFAVRPLFFSVKRSSESPQIPAKTGYPKGIRRITWVYGTEGFSTRTPESFAVPDLPVVIHGRGFPNRAVPENLAVEYPPAVPGNFNVGLLHTSLTGRPGHDTYAPCSEQDLRGKGYDYWALGHIHQPEVIGEDPWIVFAGNCQGRHARETGPRGCRLVTINDLLKVENLEWRTLDVVRWQDVRVDLDGLEKEVEALQRIRKALADAIGMAEGRLLAAKITLSGASQMHGSLHREAQRWRAEILGIAQDFGEDYVWIEQVKVSTSPVYEISELAERDALTKIVLETLDKATNDLSDFPADITEMLDVLPADLRGEVEEQWGIDNRAELMADVRAIILESLKTKGGNTQ